MLNIYVDIVYFHNHTNAGLILLEKTLVIPIYP